MALITAKEARAKATSKEEYRKDILGRICKEIELSADDGKFQSEVKVETTIYKYMVTNLEAKGFDVQYTYTEDGEKMALKINW